jgi:AraC-like DNA-binding protein
VARAKPARTVVIRSRRFDPGPPLRDFVRLYRFLKTTATPQVATRPVIARTGIVLVFNLHHSNPEVLEHPSSRRRVLPEVLLVGAQSERRTDIVMTTGWTSFSIHFKPAGFYRLFQIPVQPFTNRILDAKEVLGPGVCELHTQLRSATTANALHRLVESYLLERVSQAPPLHPVARAAGKILKSHGAIPLAKATQSTGVGVRQFQRCFSEQMGMPPKVYARVARLNFVLERKAMTPAQSWTEIAAAAGYFDYKHLVRDFKAIAGTSPAAYLSSPRRLDDGLMISRDGKVPVHF